MAARMRFDESQLSDYFARIAIPEDQRCFSVLGKSDQKQLEYLELLKKHHLVTVPFENLTLHYSWHRVIDVSPQHVFNKIVKQQGGIGRGGYCMEVNSLFHILLLSLGFDVFLAGARVFNHESKAYGGFTHCVNIVQIGSNRYMVDVGFGANGPSRAVPLELGREYQHIGPASMRLVREAIPQHVSKDSKVWIYQHKVSAEADWLPMYCFVDLEFTLEDIWCLNFSRWKTPSSIFVHKVMVVRFTTKKDVEDEGSLKPIIQGLETGDEIDGTLIIDHNKLKWRRNGSTVLERTLQSELERIDALRKYFGIELAANDRDAIRNTVGAIVRLETSKTFEALN